MAMPGLRSDLGYSMPEFLAVRAHGDPSIPTGGRGPQHPHQVYPKSWQGACPYRGAAQRLGAASPWEGRWAPLFGAEPTREQRLGPLLRGTQAELGTSNPRARRSGMASWLLGPLSHRRHGLRGIRGSRHGQPSPGHCMAPLWQGPVAEKDGAVALPGWCFRTGNRLVLTAWTSSCRPGATLRFDVGTPKGG